MIPAISTIITDTMSQPDAIATPLMSSRKSSVGASHEIDTTQVEGQSKSNGDQVGLL
jgi:hypothetical protein